MTNYKEIFYKIEKTLKQQSWFSDIEFMQQYNKFKEFENRVRKNDEYFNLLTMIVFYSGFRAATVENKEGTILGHFPDYKTVSNYNHKDYLRILSDPNMIRNKRKIQSCINNAITFNEIVNKHGSFQNYLNSFHADDSFEQLVMLKEELEYRFEYLGGITVYHLLTEIGFSVLKPDRVITRIFERLGLIENDKQFLKTVIHGRNFAKETGYPIRYIDIIFVKYGQQGESTMFGLKNGICLKSEPKCKVCGVKEHCKYFQRNE